MTIFLTYIQGIRTYTRPAYWIQEHIPGLLRGYKTIFLAYIQDTRTYSWPTYWIQEQIPGLHTGYKHIFLAYIVPGLLTGYRNIYCTTTWTEEHIPGLGTLLGNNLDTGTHSWPTYRIQEPSWAAIWIQEHTLGLRTGYRNPLGQQSGYILDRRNIFLGKY